MNQQSDACVGNPVLDIALENFPRLLEFIELNMKRQSEKTIGNKTDFIKHLQDSPTPVVRVCTKIKALTIYLCSSRTFGSGLFYPQAYRRPH
jgi:hypothetical protein